MRHERNGYTRSRDNIWAPLLQDLRERANPPAAPHPLVDWQLYMSKKTDEIDEEFNERWSEAGLDASYRLALRSEIARELLKQESSEYRAALASEAKDMHGVALAQYRKQMALGALAAAQSEDTQER